MRRDEESQSYWQSFADLGMGLVGLLILVLVSLLMLQSDKSENDRYRAQELDAFNLRMLEALREAAILQARQESVNQWLAFVFEETKCSLLFNPDSGKLESRRESDISDLYAPGSTALSERARRDLRSCRRAFRRLAACMNPEVPDGKAKALGCPDAVDSRWRHEVQAFRVGVDSLVLQGNTDRTRYKKAEPIQGLPGKLSETPAAFVENAFLGGERARQAMGHLLYIVDEKDDDSTVRNEDLDVLISRLRMESASFGRYQVGPRTWRAPESVLCSEDPSCQAARNLALKLRWSRASLRRPFLEVVRTYCDEWVRDSSAIHHSIRSFGHEKHARELCKDVKVGRKPKVEVPDPQTSGR